MPELIDPVVGYPLAIALWGIWWLLHTAPTRRAKRRARATQTH